MSYELIAPDAAEQLRRWDAGDTIWTIEMGGMGPGYEQAIQTVAIEIVRDNLGKTLPEEEDKEANQQFGMSTLNRIDQYIGMSGAQFGAARWLAYQWLKIGPKALQAEINLKDRHIQASRIWPRVPNPSNEQPDPEPGTPEAKKE